MLPQLTTKATFLNHLISRSPPVPPLISSHKDFVVPRRGFAAKVSVTGITGLGKKKIGKSGPMLEKKVLPVETDPVKLVTYCCGSNILKEGEDIKLKDDSEYPDWLWTLNTGPPLPLEKLDPDTDEYWARAVQISKRRWTSLLKLKKF